MLQDAEAARQEAERKINAASQEAETLRGQLATAAAESAQEKKYAAEHAQASAAALANVRQEAAVEAAESSRLRAALAELRAELQVCCSAWVLLQLLCLLLMR